MVRSIILLFFLGCLFWGCTNDKTRIANMLNELSEMIESSKDADIYLKGMNSWCDKNKEPFQKLATKVNLTELRKEARYLQALTRFTTAKLKFEDQLMNSRKFSGYRACINALYLR